MLETQLNNQYKDWLLLPVGAASETELEENTTKLIDSLIRKTIDRKQYLTALTGKELQFNYRKTLLCPDDPKSITTLKSLSKDQVVYKAKKSFETVFMFAGQGSQYMKMGEELYENELFFHEEMNNCFSITDSLIGFSLKEVIYPKNNEQLNFSKEKINNIDVAQLIVFVFECSIARLLIHWGIQPSSMIGYSIGEYVSACISGVISLEDAIKLIVARGELMAKTAQGMMLSVPLKENEIRPLLQGNLSIAIINVQSCVVAGKAEDVRAFEKRMTQRGVFCMPLNSSHAPHSLLMNSVVDEFEAEVRKITLNEPQIPYISNVTGTWVTGNQVTDPSYWGRHLSSTVYFAKGLAELSQIKDSIFIEVGPGRDLCILMRQYISSNYKERIVDIIRHPQRQVSDIYYLYSKVGFLWELGVTVRWENFFGIKECISSSAD